MERTIQLVAAVVVMPLLVLGYLAVVEAVLRLLRPRTARQIRPWLWSGPALVFLVVFLLAPMVQTGVASLLDAKSNGFVGLENYAYLLSDPSMAAAAGNTILWLVALPTLTVVLGLALAILTERVRYERAARALIFVPMAISYVAAGVIWKFMYEFRPEGAIQTGTLNAAWTSLPDNEPVPWLIESTTNNAALIGSAVWMLTGFSLIVLAAGLRAIPQELVEAARVDGAGEGQVVRRIIVPLLGPTIAVVVTTMAIAALKSFDLVYVLTNGAYGTDVVATQMYTQLFSARHLGRASAIAVLLLLAVLPVLAWNLRTYRRAAARS